MLLKRLADAARGQRSLRAGVLACRHLRDRAMDQFLGIATKPRDAAPHRNQHADSYACEPIDYPLARRLIRAVALAPGDVVYDVGCGMGRIVCLAARQTVTRCVGVEISESFAAAARDNAQRLRSRRSPIDIIHADATTLDYADGTVFFLCNPFGEATMRIVLDRIGRSLASHPRALRIGYANPMHEDLLQESGWLQRYDEYRSPFHERPSSFWRTIAPGTAVRYPATMPDGLMEVAA